jgi:hypothetical protein
VLIQNERFVGRNCSAVPRNKVLQQGLSKSNNHTGELTLTEDIVC